MSEIRSNDIYVLHLAVMYGIFRHLPQHMKSHHTDRGLDLLIIDVLGNQSTLLDSMGKAPPGITFNGIKVTLDITDERRDRVPQRINALIERGVIHSEWKYDIRTLSLSKSMWQAIRTYKAVPYGHRLFAEMQLPLSVRALLQKHRHHE